MKKTFKIGEYAIGGIIQVEIKTDKVIVSCLDWDTKQVVHKGLFNNSPVSFWGLKEYLLEITSSYHAEGVEKFIVENSKIKNTEFSW